MAVETQYPDQWAYSDFRDPRVIVVQVFSFLFSSTIIALGAKKLRKNRSPFYVGVFMTGFPFLATDLAYFFVLGRIISINSNEPFRTTINFLSLWQSSLLSAIRFKGFQIAGTVKWYTKTKSHILIGLLFLQGLLTIILLSYTYAIQSHLPYFPPHPWRKLLLIQQVGTSVFMNFLFDAVSFRTIWTIRNKALANERKRQELALSTQSQTGVWQRIKDAWAVAVVSGSHSQSALSHSKSTIPSSSQILQQSASSFQNGDHEKASTCAIGVSVIQSHTAAATATGRVGNHAVNPDQERLKRFQQTTAVVLCMLGFLVLTSICGFVIYLSMADLIGDAASSLCARIYVCAAVVHWTILTRIVK